MAKITIKKVAEEANVSKSTVSRYLNGNFGKMSLDTRKRIQQTIETLGYRPSRQAQTLKTHKTGLLGYVIADMGNLYSAKLMDGASQEARKNNYQLVFMNSNNSAQTELESLQKLVDQSVEGIIIQAMNKNSETYEDVLKGQSVVVVDRPVIPAKWSSVMVDNYGATATFAQQIVNRGYTRIELMTEPVDVSEARRYRYLAIKNVAAQNGLKLGVTQVRDVETEAVKKIINDTVLAALNQSEKTVIFGSNSKILAAVLKAMYHLHVKIPAQLGLCGYDDWSWTDLTNPPLAGIEQNTEEVGRQSVKLLIAHIQNPQLNIEEKIIPSKLNIRDSF